MPLITLDMNISIALKGAGIIPEVVDEFQPTTLLAIVFPNGKDVALGNQLEVGDAAQEPQVTFFPDDTSASYTLVMTDPDAPSRINQQFGEWRHWIVTNIPGDNPSLTAAQLHTPYVPPSPGANTGLHRYLFLLYRQTRGTTEFAAMSHERPDRRKFKSREFAAENGLELVAANFFLCENKA
ncbi:hypothetical protein BC937DRAFT_90948 [Endogone sp. FLAS-F59071]|nr:hypothetical protein BC937DRAFT_90948 [Endogone sp. FLAS-F59071]|eukprot:RUS16661.1 hypothetical protein BC937DRAFT_90948 [Endogone sp. FLAS-F59071]